MKDHYYIKLTPISYDDESARFLVKDEAISISPKNIMIFDDINVAIDYKQYLASKYDMFYDVSIERF